jgi:hypothetical protein
MGIRSVISADRTVPNTSYQPDAVGTLTHMRFKLICPPDTAQVWRSNPENEGFDLGDIRALLDELAARGQSYEILDRLSEDERESMYISVAIPTTLGNHYRVSEVFGSARAGGGTHFGTNVPALLVYKDDRCVDVYPHRTRKGGPYRPIRSFLQSLVENPD